MPKIIKQFILDLYFILMYYSAELINTQLILSGEDNTLILYLI